MIYLVAFGLSAAFFYLSGRFRGVINSLFAGMGIAILCLLAGARDETVGTDVLTYAKWMCLNAQHMDFLSFMRREANVAEFGWNAFTWFSVRLTGGLPGYLACIEFMCIVPVFLFLRRCYPRTEWKGMLVWLLLLYPFSLNGMRQCIAMSFCVYAMRYVLEKRPFKFVLLVITAMLFHQTSAVMLAAYPFERLHNKRGVIASMFGRWRNIAVGLLILLIIVAVFVTAPRLLRFAPLFKASYSYQLKRLGQSDFSFAGLYLLLSSLFMKRLCSKDFDDDASAQVFGFVSDAITVGGVAWQLNYIAPTLGRLGYYGTMLFCVQASLLASNGRRSSRHLFMLVVLAMVYFVVMTLVLGMSGSYPYTSVLLGIG